MSAAATETLTTPAAELERAHRQFAALQRFSVALSDSRTVEQAIGAAATEGHALFGSGAAVGYVIEDDDRTLRLVGSGGLSADDQARWGRSSIDAPILVARALREGRPLWWESREQVLSEFPHLAELEHPIARMGSACALPVHAAGKPRGALGFVFPTPRSFDTREIDFARMLVDQCALAVDRALAFQAEIAAREALERQQKALAVLAAVGDLLAGDADFADALDRLARTVVPAVADWCAIDTLVNGKVHRVAVHHPDPARVALAHELHRRWPPNPDDARGVALVLRTGEADGGAVDDALLRQIIHDEERLRVTRELGLREFLVVPLTARSRVLGALTLVFAESGRRFDQPTRELAKEIARRASSYLDRARLLKEAEVARGQLDRLFSEAPAGICMLKGAEHRFVLANEGYAALIGFDPVGKTVREALPEVKGQGIIGLLDRVYHQGETIHGRELYVRARRTLDGDPEDRWFNFVYQPLRTGDGGIEGVVVFVFDVSDQVLARRRVETLAADVSRNEARFRTLVETTTAVVWTATPAGEVVEPSSSWMAFTGQTAEQYLNGGFVNAIHPDDREPTLAIWAEATGKGGPYMAEYRLRRADGTWAETIARGAPVRNGRGEIIEYVGCNVDVTEKNRVDRALREHSEILTILNNAGIMIAGELDHDRLVQTVTDAATRLSGGKFGAFFYNVVDEEGESYTLFTLSGVPREAFKDFPMPRNTKVFGPTFRGEGVVRVDDITRDPRYGQNPPHNGMPRGHLPVRSYLAVPVISRSGKVLGGLFFGHPEPGVFTERAEQLVTGLAAQAAVAMDNASLYREAQSLINALERSNAELDQFAYVASHDLKAPLRGISNLSQWIEEDAGHQLSGESRRQLDLLRGRVQRMEALIDGILSYSRAGRTRTRAENVDVRRLVGEIVDLVGVKAPASVVTVGDLPVVYTERVPLQQVLMNLIGNGLKHARRPDARVEVSAQEKGDRVELAVRDNGPGIAPEFHDRIWGIFQTLEARDTVEGTGIGLAVVKKIVESRGGRAWVESTGADGATFRFTWPRAEKGS